MYQQDKNHLLQLPGVQSESIPADSGTAKFDFTLFVRESSQGLHLILEYATDLFKPITAQRLLHRYQCLLESLVENPDQPVSALEILPKAEKQLILREWNATAIAYPSDKTIHTLFEEQVTRSPNAPAVIFGSETITYAQLDRRACALAAELRSNVIERETPVGIHLERSIDLVVAVLATLKSGGCYVPLDPAFPRDRLAWMIEDARIPVIITQSSLVPDLPRHNARILLTNQPQTPKSGLIAPASDLHPATPDSLAYILFTSGSTGRPKGVQITHRAVVNFLHSMRKEPGLTANGTLLAVTTLSFDIAGLELLLPLTTGARIVLASRDDTIDGTRLLALLQNSGTTFMQATPATWRMLVEAGWQGTPHLKILCGGEAIDRTLADRLLSRCAELWNMYGPTETTIWSTLERLHPDQTITIGRPIANTQIYILDAALKPVPPGVSGELYIGGDGVARGYLNRPELTAEKFIADPFSSQPGARLYRTGDLARWLSDGRIDFIGRADYQVKIRGFRIELGDIETALGALDGIAQAVVTVCETTPDDKRLVAYLVLGSAANASSTTCDPAQIRTELRRTLPDYMVPAAFVFLPAFPLTPNGKVDRKALPKPEPATITNTEFEPAVGPVEEKLAAMMATLLKLPRVGRSDDFFALGGYSILAVTLFNEIEKSFGQRLPLATLFRAPTPATLAAALDLQPSPEAVRWPSLVPIQPTGSKPRFFCVHGAGGNVLLYRELAQALGNDYPFYGLQSQGLDKQSAPLTSVEDMAARYLKEILALQPKGPYCLGGYCMGGTIAYEIARRLTQAGHTVAVLALFDTYNFARMNQTTPLAHLRQKIVFHARNLASLHLKDLTGYLTHKIRIAVGGELKALWKTISRLPTRKSASQNIAGPETDIQHINDDAAEAYRPKSYPGRVTLFKPRVNYDFFPDPKMGWGDLVTGELDIVELPVNPHAMLVSPFVIPLAAELKKRIDQIPTQLDNGTRLRSPSNNLHQVALGAIAWLTQAFELGI
jgi:amino acid adenylation domain-containing protein